ncbi:MAG: glucose-1-phosphate adenylyltransferase [Bacteroidetes bacterium]|nr:glucose-1-phosphate adenylyltransferase [Bacteroidota bacterium]
MRDCIAIILGGGAGSRLFPLTLLRSKPAVPFAGKYRLIDVPVSNCINSSINKIFVLTQFNSASLNRHLAHTYRFDNYRRGFVTVMAAEQTRRSANWFQGTADAVRQSIPHVSIYRQKYVLILSGDQLYSMDYRKIIDHHVENEASVTVATIPVTSEEASGFGILKTNDDHQINEFYEKPQDLSEKTSSVSDSMKAQGREYLASMGIYVFNSDLLFKTLDMFPNDHDFGKQIIPRAIQQAKVMSYPFDGYWSDIGTIRSYYQANLMLTQPHPGFDIYNPNMRLYTNPRMLGPAKISGTQLTDTLISEGSMIGNSSINRSVIGIRSFIGNDTQIHDSVILGADYYPWHQVETRERREGPTKPGVGDHTFIEGTIIDKNVKVGNRCIIRNKEGVQEHDGENYFIRDGIVVIPKNVTIPDETVI